jgi:hypothetical protein
MTSETDQKAKERVMKREACLYVRQTTLRQVFENTESANQGCALREDAVVRCMRAHIHFCSITISSTPGGGSGLLSTRVPPLPNVSPARSKFSFSVIR